MFRLAGRLAKEERNKWQVGSTVGLCRKFLCQHWVMGLRLSQPTFVYEFWKHTKKNAGWQMQKKTSPSFHVTVMQNVARGGAE